jgi:filamentous hemagglutinin
MQAMNKIYRLVWNARKTLLDGSGRNRTQQRSACGHRTQCRRAVAAGWQSAGPGCHAAAQCDANRRQYPQLYRTNGATVVDIATANAAGVSSNQYTQYNVNSQGLVLNNGNTSQLSRQSQLAGQVYANVNLGNQASLI